MFFVCFALLGLFACSTQPKDKFPNLSSDEFERLISQENVQRLDVRTADEFSAGHIEGSININMMDSTNFAAFADSLLDIEKPVAIYCRSGRRSRKAARILDKKGYKVYNLDKGYINWVELGKEVVK